jgi:hypothetical protein
MICTGAWLPGLCTKFNAQNASRGRYATSHLSGSKLEDLKIGSQNPVGNCESQEEYKGIKTISLERYLEIKLCDARSVFTKTSDQTFHHPKC